MKSVLRSAALVAGLATFAGASSFQQKSPQDALLYKPAPELIGTDWLDAPEGKPMTLESLKGKVVMVTFFASRCINCKRNLKAYGRIQDRFKHRDFVHIAIHTPELKGENEPEAIRAMLKEYGVTFPVLRDGESKNWKAWKQEWWPTVHLIDKKGVVQGRWAGELAYNGAKGEELVTRKIQDLLADR